MHSVAVSVITIVVMGMTSLADSPYSLLVTSEGAKRATSLCPCMLVRSADGLAAGWNMTCSLSHCTLMEQTGCQWCLAGIESDR